MAVKTAAISSVFFSAVASAACPQMQLSWPELRQQRCWCEQQICRLQWQYQTPPNGRQLIEILTQLQAGKAAPVLWLDDPIHEQLQLQFAEAASKSLCLAATAPECKLQKTGAAIGAPDRYPSSAATAY